MQKTSSNVVKILISIWIIQIIFTISAQETIDSSTNSNLSYVDSLGLLYLFDTEFSNSDQIIDFAIEKHNWSPDGTQVVYNIAGSESDIYIYDIATMEQTQVTFSDGGTFVQNINPVWSPDGTKIAFASNRDENWEIYVVQLDTMDQFRLTENNFDDGLNGLTWTPESDAIAFVRDRDIYFDEETQSYEEQQLYLVEVSDLEQQQSEEDLINLTRGNNICDAGEVYHNPSWANNTNLLAFALSCGGGDDMDIYLIDMSSVESNQDLDLINLTADIIDAQAGFRAISWDLSGTQLAFTGFDDENSSSEIFVIDTTLRSEANEFPIRQVTQSPTNAVFESVAWKLTSLDD